MIIIDKLPTFSSIECHCLAEYIEKMTFFDAYANDDFRNKALSLVRILRASILITNITEKIAQSLKYIFADEEEFILFKIYAEEFYPTVNTDSMKDRLKYEKNIKQY
jgi:hypothetical protein